ncbi:MAG: VOC family protein [Candidatus Binatia bacterium]
MARTSAPNRPIRQRPGPTSPVASSIRPGSGSAQALDWLIESATPIAAQPIRAKALEVSGTGGDLPQQRSHARAETGQRPPPRRVASRAIRAIRGSLRGEARASQRCMQETAVAPLSLTAINHVGIRVMRLDASLAFYRNLGFELVWHDEAHRVAGLRNPAGLELNLIVNADDANDGKNILMDASARYPGYTHVSFRVASIGEAVRLLKAHRIPIAEGPVKLGRQITVFVRDPDRNVVELAEIEGA